MRLVDGDDLRTLVRREGPRRSTSRVRADRAGGERRWTRSTAPASSIATSSRATCWSTASGHVYLTDFGLAKHMLASTGATRTGRWVGTLDYIAPEQIRGGRIDARADVYALGGVLHYVLTGHVPFERDDDEAKLWAQLSARRRRRRRCARTLPAALRCGGGPGDGQGPGRALSVGGRPRPRGAGGGDGRCARQARADGRARRRRPGYGSDRARARRGGLARSRPGRRRPRAAGAAAGRRVAGVLLAAAVAGRRRGAGGRRKRAAGAAESRGRAAAAPARHGRRRPTSAERPTGIAFAGGDLWVTSVSEPTADPDRRGDGPRASRASARRAPVRPASSPIETTSGWWPGAPVR